MDDNHIEGSDFCLCDDCTQGFSLSTPRMRGGADIDYAIEKMKHELSGTAGWSQRDWNAAIRASSAAALPRALRPKAQPAVGENSIGGCSVEEYEQHAD